MASDRERKLKERERLKNVISQWNANRLDIFWLSDPSEDLEFHGAMRFYFQDAGEKVATKCIRVSSTASTSDVIETLIEKFRPDIRMLSIPEYAIYEIHENGEERKLRDDEKPLLVHLDWHKDDREGRFLLRRMDEKSYISNMDAYDNDHFKRKLSKREKKDKKKREKKEKLKLTEEAKKEGIAERLYLELPETSFTRSISNPEAVMRRRRQQQLEKRLQQFCQEGGTDAGGTLRIFGESINKDVPYKTLLLSMKDTAAYVVKEILDKYAQDKEDPVQYCLVQVLVPPQASSDGSIHEYQTGGVREYILDDDDCPLAIEHQHNRGRGTLTFHVRRRPADYQPRKRKKKPKPTKGDLENSYRYEDSFEKLPYLMELNPDGSEVQGAPKKHRLYLNVTEVGCERSSSTSGQYLQLFGPNVHPRHCVIAHTEGIVTVTPSSREAETYVNNIRIFETTILKHGMKVRFGKLHTFRFMNPLHEQKQNALPDPRQSASLLEKPSRREDQMPVHHPGSYETTFDAEGNVETISTHSRDDRMSKKSDDAHSHRSLGRESSQGRGSYEQRRGNDPILPAVLEFWEESEDKFLTAAVTQLDPSHVQFKLSPTYTLYMAARYRASTHFRPETTPSDRAHRLTALMNKVAAVMHQVIQDRYRDSSSLAFWLANTSELLNFLKQDRHLSAYTLDAQDLLAESVQLAFCSLITCQQAELQSAMPAFLEDKDDISEEEGTTADVLAVLSAAMSLLRMCRVNAALTIQMFSQLFNYINMWLFNKVVCDSRSNYCTRLWGVRLKRRLNRVEAWAEMQGLELAADCHLSRIVQAAHLLQVPKSSPDDRTAISSCCFRLNSLQLRSILEKYVPVPEEPEIPLELIESVVKFAENTADEQARSEGREIKLQEDADLQLPFLLPKDGYSYDIVRGVPAGLQEFLQPLIQAGWCQLTIQPTSSGYWTIYMADQDIGCIPPGARSPSVHSHTGDGEGQTWNQQLPVPEVSAIRLQKNNNGAGMSIVSAGACSPSVHSHTGDGELQTWNQQLPVPEVTTIRLQKSNNGIGLSIVAAGGIDQDKLGIYVRSVVKGGAADLDGRLQAGDQLLKVDGQSLVGVNQEKAAELMTRTGPVITLEVAKQGAIYNGLADLVSKPSPIIQRGPRRMSERDIPGRLMSEQGQEFRHPSGPGHLMPPRMQSSKSVPSLNSGHTQESPRAPSNGTFHTHEVYNPAYSRTSSTTSIPKSAEFAENNTRARSSNNIRQELPSDARYPPYSGLGDQNPPPYPGPPATVNGRPLSQPNLQQLPPPPPGHQEERHYQNISLYQQPQQQPAQQQPNSGLHSRPPAQPYPHPPTQPTRPLHGSQSSLNRPEPQGLQMPNDRSRPLSTLVSPREQEQYANSMGYAHSPNSGPPPSPKGPRLPTDNRHGPQAYGPRLPDHRDFHSTEHLRHMENDQRSIHSESWEQNHRPFPPHKEMDPRQHHMDPMHQLDARQRDLIRQEAKMEEMREEVRRREDRERMVQNQMVRGPAPWGYPRGPNPNMQPPPGYMPPPGSVPLGNGPPPPQGPKPRPQFSSPHANERFQRPPPGYEPSVSEGPPYYQEAAHPQTFPNSGHPPMVQQHNQQRPNHPPPAVSYRYGPTGYPPRSEGPAKPSQPPRPPHNDPRVPAPHGRPPLSQSQNSRVTFELPQSSSGHDRKDPSNLTSPSPWEREEKEKLHKQRLEEARRARDEEIMQLESIPYMSAKQEERLRTLRLEREFQRRAEELHGDEEDDDDDELLERAENRERMLKMQEDLEKARQRRLEWEQDQPHLNQPKQPPMTQQEEWKKHHSLEEQEGRLRQLRLEEVNRKKELEAAKSAEERLLREARRRQDEYKGPQAVQPPPLQSKPNQQDNTMFMSQNYAPQKNQGGNLYSQDDVPPPLPTSPPPIETNYSTAYNQNQVDQPKMASHPPHSHPSLLRNQPNESSHSIPNNIRVPGSEKLHEPPAPPQRKSSYEVTNQISSINNRYITSAVRNGDGGNPGLHPKKVSFHDSHLEREVTCDTNGNMDYINQTHHSVNSSQPYTLDDIDEVLATPQNTQNLNMYNPGATPGVIGAQEVYKDPRQRIEAERTQQEHYTSRSVGPEKLTFKEKMKMFAQETGEPETPKDKVKISRAQRDIETNLNGT